MCIHLNHKFYQQGQGLAAGKPYQVLEPGEKGPVWMERQTRTLLEQKPRSKPLPIIELSKYWDEPESVKMRWKAPNGLYWTCGKKAYSELPQCWKGSCTVGLIRPVFFTPPRPEHSSLGAPLYKSLSQERRSLKKVSSLWWRTNLRWGRMACWKDHRVLWSWHLGTAWDMAI